MTRKIRTVKLSSGSNHRLGMEPVAKDVPKYIVEEQKKKDFVKRNIQLFEEAYLEISKRDKGGRYGPKVTEFINLTKTEFQYSKYTVIIDIWSKFQFWDINQVIDSKERAKHLQKPEIRRALGHG